MKVHEYQAKQILARYGVAVPRGEVTDSPAAAREIAKRLGGRAVVKAQIHAGGERAEASSSRRIPRSPSSSPSGSWA
jgi:succinyl-CoA synthetase beta subunit